MYIRNVSIYISYMQFSLLNTSGHLRCVPIIGVFQSDICAQQIHKSIYLSYVCVHDVCMYV